MRLKDFSSLLKKTSIVFAIVSLIGAQAAAAGRKPNIAPLAKKPVVDTKTEANLGSKPNLVKSELKGAAINLQPSILLVDDCGACHDNCLATSLTCIAISAITGCLPCGAVCLAGQAACHIICNGTSACAQPVAPPAN